MNRIFDIDNPVWNAFSKLFDLIILNILFLLTCIPVVTIGNSITALYYTTLRMTSKRLTYATSEYWKSWKENFKQGLLCEVLLFDIGVMLAVGTYFSFVTGAYYGKVIFVMLDVMAVAVASYVFPLLAKFQMTTAQLFRSSVLMAVRYLPFTILNVVIILGSIYFTYQSFLVFLIMLVVGCSAVCVLQSVWFNYIFNQFTPEEEHARDRIYQQEEEQAKREKQKMYR